MTLPVLNLKPQSAGYAVDFGNQVLATKLDGGASRYKQDILGAAHIVDVTWLCTPQAYNYLMAFWRTAISNGLFPFQLDMMLDTASFITYQCRFIPGTLKLMGITGITYTVKAQLEVVPNSPTTADDNTVIAAGPGF
jgi:hypothetical protein